jgi:putative nucleotidyltransferase with HDIG domain
MKNTGIRTSRREPAILELNDNQGLSPKKTKNINHATSEVATKIAGVFKLPSFREGMLIIFCFVLIIILLQIKLFPKVVDIKAGQANKEDIIAPKDVIDREATERAQREAIKRAMEVAEQNLDYYMIDDSAEKLVIFHQNRFFETVDQIRKNYAETGRILEVDLRAAKFGEFFTEPPDADMLRDIIQLPPDLYHSLKNFSMRILVDLESTEKIDPRNIAVTKLELPQLIKEQPVPGEIKDLLERLLTISIRPNLMKNANRIEKLQNRVRLEVPPVIHRRGEVLIAKNQIITPNDMKMLKELHVIVDRTNQIQVFLSLAFFVLLLIGLGWVYLYQFHPEFFKQERLLYLLLLLILLVLGMIKVLSLIEYPSILYLAPVSFAAMLITILINPQLALMISFILSLIGGIIGEYNLALTIFYFTSGAISVFSLTHFHRQRDLVRTGSILMVLHAITVVVLNLLFRTGFDFWAVILATLNGFLSAVLAIGTIPFLEHIFRLTSPTRLLELSNPGHPLLRRLQIEAPGTYQHSIMVGNLAEAAAEGIGANALWARVGSYYHDIGKIRRPYFFVENQFTQENPHEKLNPTLSTLIITYHVKEGAEIAREHGLPDQLIDIIEQHHGMDLVRYFYKRATENVQGEKEILNEGDFRYEGPKPQTKEAALVMLADSVEAAVRSLPKPTPSKVEALIHKIIRERLDDGQFDECNLTLKDLNQIKLSFIKVMGGLFHNRIEYPEVILKEMERKKTNGDSSK